MLVSVKGPPIKWTPILALLMSVQASNAVGQLCPNPPVPFDSWKPLAGFAAPAAVKNALHARDPAWSILSISAAAGDSLNTDFYTLQITSAPTVNGHAASASDFTTYVRQHLGDFLDPSLASYAPFAPQDAQPLANGTPGAIARFSITIPGLPVATRPADVVLSASTSTSWTFSTIKTTLPHPVSGHRQWSVVTDPNLDGYLLTIRGVDRVTTLVDKAFEGTIFLGGNAVWMTFINNVQLFVNAHGGAASTPLPQFSFRTVLACLPDGFVPGM